MDDLLPTVTETELLWDWARLNYPVADAAFKNYIATVLSLIDVANLRGGLITMDTRDKREFWVNLEDGKILKFVECASGLYFYNTCNIHNMKVTGYVAVQTVRENKKLQKK